MNVLEMEQAIGSNKLNGAKGRATARDDPLQINHDRGLQQMDGDQLRKYGDDEGAALNCTALLSSARHCIELHCLTLNCNVRSLTVPIWDSLYILVVSLEKALAIPKSINFR